MNDKMDLYRALNESYTRAPNLPDAQITEVFGLPYYAETYPKGESQSPDSRKNLIRLAPNELSFEERVSMITGERSHLGKQDSEYRKLRDSFIGSLEPEQKDYLKSRYEMSGDQRPFSQWLDVSFYDSLIRDYNLPNLPSSDKPEDREKFREEFYTPDNKSALEALLDYISQPVTPYD